MSTGATISIAVEGMTDAPVVTRLARDHGFEVSAVLGLHGKAHLDQKLPAYNAAARFGAWLVVRDLDHDAPCAAELIRTRLPAPSKGMLFRVAVRSIEAWLLADNEGISSFFRVARHHVPNDPENLRDPKAALVELSKRSRLRAIRDDMVPAAGTTARVGPGFLGRVTEFADDQWSWRRAASRSESLRRCVRRVAALG